MLITCFMPFKKCKTLAKSRNLQISDNVNTKSCLISLTVCENTGQIRINRIKKYKIYIQTKKIRPFTLVLYPSTHFFVGTKIKLKCLPYARHIKTENGLTFYGITELTVTTAFPWKGCHPLKPGIYYVKFQSRTTEDENTLQPKENPTKWTKLQFIVFDLRNRHPVK